MDLAKQLRAAILKSGKSQLALSKETKVPQQRISAFMNGGDMKLRYAGALMDAVGLTVKVLTTSKRKR